MVQALADDPVAITHIIPWLPEVRYPVQLAVQLAVQRAVQRAVQLAVQLAWDAKG